MPPWGLANFLVPLFRTSPTNQGVWFQQGQYWTTSYYAGIGTILLWTVALRRRGGWRVWLLAGLLALALALALGDPGLVYRGLRFCFPGIGFVRYPVKFVILVLAVAPLLAAFGAEALARPGSPPVRFERAAAAGLLVLIGITAFLGWAFPVGDFRNAPLVNGLARAAFLILMVLLMGALLRAAGSRRRLLVCLLLAVVWLDFVTHAPRQNPSVQPSVFAVGNLASLRNWTPPPRLGESRAMISPFADGTLRRNVIGGLEKNYTVCRLALLADCNLLEEVPQTYGFFSLVPQEINNVAALPYARTNVDYPVMLDFMGVSQITAPGELCKWTFRPTAMPLVTAGQRAVFMDAGSAYAGLSGANLDLRGMVMLPPEASGSISATQRVAARVLKADFEPQSVSVQTEAPAATMVVISQSYYPAWQATIDGRPAKLWRANYAFQAIEVPAGRHAVRLVYFDKAFRLGCLLSALGLMTCLGLWMLAHFRGARAAAH
jgi:hypothetical protein